MIVKGARGKNSPIDLRTTLRRLCSRYRAAVYRDFQRWKKDNQAVAMGMTTTELSRIREKFRDARMIDQREEKAEVLRQWTEGMVLYHTLSVDKIRKVSWKYVRKKYSQYEPRKWFDTEL